MTYVYEKSTGTEMHGKAWEQRRTASDTLPDILQRIVIQDYFRSPHKRHVAQESNHSIKRAWHAGEKRKDRQLKTLTRLDFHTLMNLATKGFLKIDLPSLSLSLSFWGPSAWESSPSPWRRQRWHWLFNDAFVYSVTRHVREFDLLRMPERCLYVWQLFL